MDVRITMRQAGPDRWVATGSDGAAIEATGASREECLENARRTLRAGVTGSPEEPVTLIVEVAPVLAGVAEAAQVMGWDKRRVITYLDRGRFPEPVQALASGRVWIRSDVERFAREWHERQAARRRRRARA